MKKVRILFFSLVLVMLALVMTSCGTDVCLHAIGDFTWREATCTSPKTCWICSATKGEPLGHSWSDATCAAPKTCTECGATEGESLDHTWLDATCTSPKKCTVCQATEGNALNHTGGVATCQSKAVCDVCGEEYGELSAENHTGEIIWRKLNTTHHQVYSCCETGVTEKEAHNKVDGICNTCGFEPKLMLSSAEIDSDTTEVVFVLSVEDNPGILGMELTLTYDDSVMTLVEASAGEALSGLAFSSSDTLTSGCSFIFDGVEIQDKDIFDGEALILTFTVDEVLEPDAEYSVLFKAKVYDGNLDVIPFKIYNGVLTIK